MVNVGDDSEVTDVRQVTHDLFKNLRVSILDVGIIGDNIAWRNLGAVAAVSKLGNSTFNFFIVLCLTVAASLRYGSPQNDTGRHAWAGAGKVRPAFDNQKAVQNYDKALYC